MIWAHGTPARWAAMLGQSGCLVLLLVATAGAQWEPPAASPAGDIWFHRRLVPNELVTELARGYVPVLRDDFEAWLQQLRLAAERASAMPPQIAHAQYHGRVDAAGLLTGRAEWKVQSFDERPALLVLSPLNLALSELRWQSSDEPVAWGLDRQGRSAVRVGQPGDLSLNWSAQGQRDDLGNLSLPLQLPASAITEIWLEVPRPFLVQTEGGLATLVDSDAGDDAPGTADVQRWHLRLASQSSFHLMLLKRPDTGQPQPSAFVQTQTAYRLNREGLDVRSELRLDVGREPLAQLQLVMDPALHLTEASLEEQPLEWTELISPDNRQRIVLLQLPAELQGTQRLIRISAMATLQLDRPWQLPTLSVAQTSWREATASLEISETLLLDELHVEGGDQIEQLRNPMTGDLQRVFQFFQPSGRLRVEVSPRPSGLQVDMGTTIDLAPSSLTARVVADVATDFGEVFQFDLDVHEGWIIDSVTAEPSGVLDHFESLVVENERQRLRIHMARPLTPDQPVQFVIRGHHSAVSKLNRAHFRPLTVIHADRVDRFAAIQPDPSFQLRVQDDGDLARLDPQQLPSAISRLLEVDPSGFVFVDNEQASRLSLELEPGTPAIAAEIAVTATAFAGTLEEHFTIHCRPDASAVNRLIVQISQPSDEPVRWSLFDDQAGVTAERLAASDQENEGSAPLREQWQLDFDRPLDRPFTVQGTRVVPLGPSTPVGLVGLANPTSQSATLTITSRDGTAISIEQYEMRPIPARATSRSQYQTTLGRFRYEPASEARVTLHSQPTRPVSDAWVWSSHMVSQVDANGAAMHQVTMRLENGGRAGFTLRLPPGTRLEELRVNDVGLPPAALPVGDGPVSVSLPSDVRFPVVEIRFRQRGHPLSNWGHWQSEFPVLDIPVLQRFWTLWLPPGFAVSPDDPQVERFYPPSSWLTRMFGPLARKDDQSVFRPLQWRQWPAVAARRNDQAARAHGEQLLQTLGQLIQAEQDRESTINTWGQWFDRYQQSLIDGPRPGEPPVLVDETALAAIQILPLTPLPSIFEGTAFMLAEQMFQDAGLQILARPDRLLITSRASAARYGDLIESIDSSVITLLNDRPDLTSGPADPSALSHRVVSLSSWTVVSSSDLQPWLDQPDDVPRGLVTQGWTATTIPVTSGQSVGRLAYYRPATMQAWAGAVCLVMAGLGAWIAARRLAAWILVTATMAALAFVWPVTLIPIGAAAFLGSLAGWLLAMMRAPRLRTVENSMPGSRPLASTASFGTLLLVASLLVVAAEDFSQPAAAENGDPVPADVPHNYPVLFPVDADKKPVGQYVFMPQAFYDLLQQRVASEQDPALSWLLNSARYELEVNSSIIGSQWEISRLMAEFQLTTYRPEQRVVLPLGQEDNQIVQARIDDIPALIQWNHEAHQIEFQIDEPGQHVVQLDLQPMVTIDPRLTTFSIRIPKVSESSLTVQYPAAEGEMRVPFARGHVQDDRAQGTLNAELGPTDTLTVQWPTDTDRGTVSVGGAEVEQFLWLTVQPNSVVLESKFTWIARRGRIEEVKLLADPRLRLLPLRNDRLLEPQVISDGGPLQTIVLPLVEPVSDEFSFSLRFMVTEATGIGHIPLPQLEPVAELIRRRWLAVSVGELQASFPEAPDLAAVDIADFVLAWGNSEQVPTRAYALADGSPGWSLATSLPDPQTRCVQQQDISVGASSMDVDYLADIETSGGYLFQLRLAAPAELSIPEVNVICPGEPCQARAARTGPDELTVFFSRAMSGNYQLDLRGRRELTTATAQQVVSLPTIFLHGADIDDDTIRVYRRSDARVDLRQVTGMVADNNADRLGEFSLLLGRLLAVFRPTADAADNGSYRAQLRIRPNTPRLRFRVITQLDRENDQWIATARVRVWQTNNSGGLIDRVRLEIPAEWTLPLQFEPDVQWQLETIPGQSRRQLIIRPTQSVRDEFEVVIRGALSTASSERIRAPDIAPLDAVGPVRRFLVLPTQVQRQRIQWDTSNMVSQPLPAGEPAVDPDRFAVYLLGDKPRATVSDVQRIAGQRQVNLADIHVAIQPDGHLQGLAVFDLEPASTRHCDLVLPEDLELIHVRIAGMPAALSPLGPNKWRLSTAFDQLPQRIEVVFAGRRDAAAGQQLAISTPRLDGVDTVRTLWTIYAPHDSRLVGDNLQPHRVSQIRQEQIRLRSTSNLIDMAADVALQNPPAEISDWYRPWAQRLVASSSKIGKYALASSTTRSDPPAQIKAELEATAQQHLSIADRLQTSAIWRGLVDDPSQIVLASDVWQRVQGAPEEALHCAFLGPQEQMVVQFAAAPPKWRFGIALLALAVGLLACWALTRTRWVIEWLADWPHAVGVLIGILWWILLTPSWLGMALMIVTLFAAFRPPWPLGTAAARPRGV